MRKSEFTKLLVSAFGALPLLGFAQAGSADFPSVAASSVVIVNSAGVGLNFSLRPEDGNWAKYSLAPSDQTTISCAQCTAEWFEFVMATEGKQVSYNLEPGKRYALKWNASNSVWDIYAVQ
jgi:hypothetical protein